MVTGMRKLFVIEDPKREYWPGALVDPSLEAQLKDRGVAMIQVCPELFKRNAVAGVFVRHWGSGWVLNPALPARVAPMVLYVAPTHRTIQWAMRLLPVKGVALDGYLRIVGDSGQLQVLSGGLSAENNVIEMATLGLPDAQGGWTVSGTMPLSLYTEGYLGMTWYGAARGVRVIWAAVSQLE